jgi:glutamate synthase domain-containing protein 3
MTGGTVVCLGEVRRNAGAVMTGGVAYLLDEKGDFPKRYNPQLVRIVRIEKDEDEEQVQSMIAQHLEYTGSPRAKEILTHWRKYAPLFWKVEPQPTETKIRTEVVVNVNRDETGRPVQMDELLKPVKDK